MTLTSPYIVHLQKPESLLAEAMAEIRSWLDSREIQPVEFKSGTAPGRVLLEIRFRSEDDACLFTQEFA